MAPTPRPLQVPGDYYSREEESLFRRGLENSLLEISATLDRVEGGRSSISTASSLRLSSITIPVGQVEVG